MVTGARRLLCTRQGNASDGTDLNVTKETYLHTDASTLGIGFVLRQRSHEREASWKTVQAGSRFLTDTKSRYAVIELECLAVAWAVKKCSIFLSGLDHFTIITDNDPLIPILNSHRLDEIKNPRLQRLRTSLMAFNFTAQWLKGKDNEAADTLSRHPHQVPRYGDELAEHEMNIVYFTLYLIKHLQFQKYTYPMRNHSR